MQQDNTETQQPNFLTTTPSTHHTHSTIHTSTRDTNAIPQHQPQRTTTHQHNNSTLLQATKTTSTSQPNTNTALCGAVYRVCDCAGCVVFLLLCWSRTLDVVVCVDVVLWCRWCGCCQRCVYGVGWHTMPNMSVVASCLLGLHVQRVGWWSPSGRCSHCFCCALRCAVLVRRVWVAVWCVVTVLLLSVARCLCCLVVLVCIMVCCAVVAGVCCAG